MKRFLISVMLIMMSVSVSAQTEEETLEALSRTSACGAVFSIVEQADNYALVEGGAYVVILNGIVPDYQESAMDHWYVVVKQNIDLFINAVVNVNDPDQMNVQNVQEITNFCLNLVTVLHDEFAEGAKLKQLSDQIPSGGDDE